MTTGGIFLIGGDGLIELAQQAYESEGLLQSLLAEYPKLLAGEQMDPVDARRWVLVRREAAVPDRDGGGGRWALDHLFLDQDAVPTLVEVKRSTDSRIRREVVGQMLDYAANGVVYWPIEQLIRDFEDTCAASGFDPEEAIERLTAGEATSDEYWTLVKTNLQAGRIRMVFVADEIPAELQRIVEFLNGQLDPAEVFAVEVRQYSGAGATALVPRLVGQTAEAQIRKTPHRSSMVWDRDSFLASIGEHVGPDAAATAEQVVEWAESEGLRVQWGRGQTGSLSPKLERDGVTHNMFTIFGKGTVEIPFGAMKPPHGDPESRRRLHAELTDAIGDVVGTGRIDGYPRLSISSIEDGATLKAFLAVWSRYLARVRGERQE
jgi:hypothetical protein